MDKLDFNVDKLKKVLEKGDYYSKDLRNKSIFVLRNKEINEVRECLEFEEDSFHKIDKEEKESAVLFLIGIIRDIVQDKKYELIDGILIEDTQDAPVPKQLKGTDEGTAQAYQKKDNYHIPIKKKIGYGENDVEKMIKNIDEEQVRMLKSLVNYDIHFLNKDRKIQECRAWYHRIDEAFLQYSHLMMISFVEVCKKFGVDYDSLQKMREGDMDAFDKVKFQVSQKYPEEERDY